jgi:hypothetical protein
LRLVDFSLLTEPIELNEFKIEFNNLKFLEKYCNNNQVSTTSKKLKCIKNGQLDAFVIWFDLNLNEKIKINNSPLIRNNCTTWHQSIYSIQIKNEIKKDDFIECDVKLRKDCFLLMSKLNDIPNPIKSVQLDLSRPEISLLNNQNYQESYLNWFSNNEIHDKFKQIGFLSSTFNLILFEIIYKYSFKFNYKIIYFINSEDDVNLKKNLENNFTNIEIVCLNDAIEGKTKFNIDCLVIEPIDCKYGILRKNLFEDILFIKSMNATAKSKLIIL